MTNEELQAILATRDPKAEVVFASFEYGPAHGVRSVDPRPLNGYARGDGANGYGDGWWTLGAEGEDLTSQRSFVLEDYANVGPIVPVIVLCEGPAAKGGRTDG